MFCCSRENICLYCNKNAAQTPANLAPGSSRGCYVYENPIGKGGIHEQKNTQFYSKANRRKP